MTRARLRYFSKSHPSGHVAEWWEIITLHGDREHRSSDRTFKTEAEARARAEAEGMVIED